MQTTDIRTLRPPTRVLARILVVLAAIIVLIRSVAVVPAGHVGIVDLFGRVSPRTLKPGINMKNPFALVARLSVKTQEVKEVMQVPSKEGLSVSLEVSVLFHLDPEKAPQVYQTVGARYQEVLLEPNFRSITRGVTSTYEARALYTSEREHLGREIQEQLMATVGPRGIVVESTPLRKVDLPPKLTAAIEEKLQVEQESQRMQFVLQKESQEADRKRIEARGIADFQAIVSQGLSDPFLRWKGIEATERLVSSSNGHRSTFGTCCV